MDKQQCEGYRRYGGAFTFGTPVWKQCKNKAVVTLFIKQDKKREVKPMPSCTMCWKEALTTVGIKVVKVEPIE